MLMKKIDISALNVQSGKVSEAEALENEYTRLLQEFEDRIGDLPPTCPFKRQARAVLQTIKTLKEPNTNEYPLDTILETLRRTNLLLTPPKIEDPDDSLELIDGVDSDASGEIELEKELYRNKFRHAMLTYLNSITSYEEFVEQLEFTANFQSLASDLLKLVGLIFLTIFVVGMIVLGGGSAFILIALTTSLFASFFAFFDARKLGCRSDQTFELAEFSEALFLGVKKACEEKAEALATTPSQLQTNPDTQDHYLLGLSALDKDVATAKDHFAKVPETDRRYELAQRFFKAYTIDPTTGSPSRFELLELDPSTPERHKRPRSPNADRELEEIRTGGESTARRRLNFNDASDLQTLIGEVADWQAEEREKAGENQESSGLNLG